MSIVHKIAEFIRDCEKWNYSPSDTSNAGMLSMHSFFRIWEEAANENDSVQALPWGRIAEDVATHYCELKSRDEMTPEALRLMESADHVWGAWNHFANARRQD